METKSPIPRLSIRPSCRALSLLTGLLPYIFPPTPTSLSPLSFCDAQLLKRDGQLQKKLTEYDEKVTATNNKINQLKLQVNRPTPSEDNNNEGGGAPASGAGGSGPNRKGCTQCVAPAASR